MVLLFYVVQCLQFFFCCFFLGGEGGSGVWPSQQGGEVF